MTNYPESHIRAMKTILSFMERVDPNGEYDLHDMSENPLAYAEIIEGWKQDLMSGCELSEKERVVYDDMISTLQFHSLLMHYKW